MPGLWRRLRAIVVPPEETPAHLRAFRLAGLAVIAAFAAFALAKMDVRRVLASIAASSPGWLLAAALANVLNLWIHAARWAAVVRPPGIRVRMVDVFEAMVAGFAAGLAVPARAGDLVRSHLLARRAGLSTASVVAAAAVDYVIATAALVPLLALLGLATPLPGWARQAMLGAAIVSGAGVLVVILLRPRPGAAVAEHGIAALVARFRSGLSAAHEPGAIARCLAWGVVGWGTELLVAWGALAAVGIDASWAVAGLAVLATAAANAIAVSPGNAGPFELAAMLPLAGLGVAHEPALAFALLYHAAHLAPVAVLGAIVLVREAGQVRA
jgi:uncharacterized membrane protein YbhN (UPF0104 family)